MPATRSAFEAGNYATDLTEGNPVRLRALRVEANFLEVFGIRPLAMISYGLWRRRFAADPRAVGRMLSLDGAPAAPCACSRG